jgi:hypothetical protein
VIKKKRRKEKREEREIRFNRPSLHIHSFIHSCTRAGAVSIPRELGKTQDHGHALRFRNLLEDPDRLLGIFISDPSRSFSFSFFSFIFCSWKRQLLEKRVDVFV